MKKIIPDEKIPYVLIIGLFALLILAALVGILGFALGNSLQNSMTGSQVDLNVSAKCIAEGGTWIGSVQECEGISEPSCRDLSGKFNACASPCRNQSGEVICIQMCVQVCEFNNGNSAEKISSEDAISIKISTNSAEDEQYALQYKESETVINFLNRLSNSNTNFKFQTESFSFGDMNISINDITPDTNKQFWAFKVNGKDSDVGVSQYIIQKNDLLEFSLTDIQ